MKTSLPNRSVIAFILIIIHIILVEVFFIAGEEKYLKKILGTDFLVLFQQE